MREISLLQSRIFVWPGLSAEVGENTKVLAGGTKAFILTDRHCAKIASRVGLSLRSAGYGTSLHAISPGEKQKSLATAAKLYDDLLSSGMERSSVLVAVGGGVVGDLGGFVASTYMRGIPWVNVPTTLLAQVDAAIGGKTGVNLRRGKNLVGTFHQPRVVFADPTVLSTLPERDYIGGLAEVVKYGMIQDADLFQYVERNIGGLLKRVPQILEEVVFRCASLKAAVVEKDEKESGLRAILNYGHTIGHGIENAGGYAKLHHGEAISIGMEAEAIMSMELGITTLETITAQNRVLKMCGLPTRMKRLSTAKILRAVKVDKKVKEGRPRYVLPEAVGKARIGVDVPDDVVAAALRTVSA